MSQLSLEDSLDIAPETRIDPDEWPEYRTLPGKPQIVVGGPGTGKTQFLCERASAAIEGGIDPTHIVILTFSRSGVADIRQRLTSLIGAQAHRINVATYHSFAMRLIEAHASDLGWGSAPTILTGTEHEQLVEDLLKLEDPSTWPAAYKPILHSPVMTAEVTDFILRTYEQMGSATTIADAGRDQWSALPSFFGAYEDALRSSGRIDYGMVLVEGVRLLDANPDLAPAYGLIAADEYQDTSPVQARLLLALAHRTDNLVVAADPYQSIYSFRGADINNVFDFPSAVRSATGRDADRLVLTTSFRVPQELLEAAVAVTARELPGGAGRVLSTRTGGTVASHEFPSTSAEAEWIAADIERVHLTDGIPLDRIAVFTRSHGTFTDDLTMALDRRSIAHTQAEERLADEPIIRFLHDLVTAATGQPDEGRAALRRVLLGPYVALSPGLVSTMPAESAEWRSWLVDVGPRFAPIGEAVHDNTWATIQPAAEGLWHVWSSLDQLHDVATGEAHGRDRLAWTSYAQVLDRIQQRASSTTLVDHAALTSRFDFEADSLFSVHDAHGVTIATLHRSKGTEYDLVYIANAVEGSLPDLRTRDSLLGARHLNPHLPTSNSEYKTFRLDEERRLAYTAMTRSTARTVWTATRASDEGTGRAPSRFMRLVSRTTPATTSIDPLTPRAMIASLRRVLADPLSSTVERLAALSFLGTTDDGRNSPLDRYGVRPIGQQTPITPATLRLSPSQAGSYSDCPRKYAVERFMLSAVDESVYMRLGTLIHSVLERAEAEALDAGMDRSTEAHAHELLESLWPTDGFGDDAVGLAWKRRATQLLSNLYSGWPSSGVPVAIELDLELVIDGTPWRGRADRVEQIGDALTVVDYKTGSATTVAKAASSAQLGFYVLAAMEDDDLSEYGTVQGAEFWYPKLVRKDSIATRTFDMDLIEDVHAVLAGIAQDIRGEAFDPKLGPACRTCPVTSTCPAQPVGVEAFTP